MVQFKEWRKRYLPDEKKIKPPSIDDVLRNYGLSEAELERLVQEAKSQPELIQKLRMKLTGSTKYDPRYQEIEVLYFDAGKIDCFQKGKRITHEAPWFLLRKTISRALRFVEKRKRKTSHTRW